jgi:hypothetical protein
MTLPKRLILAALGLAIWAPAKAEYPYSFGADDTTYRILPSSLSTKTTKEGLTISALWEVSSPTYDSRWYVEVRGCAAPIGEIAIHGGIKLSRYSWSWDGNRAIDLIASAHCGLNTLEKKK